MDKKGMLSDSPVTLFWRFTTPPKHLGEAFWAASEREESEKSMLYLCKSLPSVEITAGFKLIPL